MPENKGGKGEPFQIHARGERKEERITLISFIEEGRVGRTKGGEKKKAGHLSTLRPCYAKGKAQGAHQRKKRGGRVETGPLFYTQSFSGRPGRRKEGRGRRLLLSIAIRINFSRRGGRKIVEEGVGEGRESPLSAFGNLCAKKRKSRKGGKGGGKMVQPCAPIKTDKGGGERKKQRGGGEGRQAGFFLGRLAGGGKRERSGGAEKRKIQVKRCPPSSL